MRAAAPEIDATQARRAAPGCAPRCRRRLVAVALGMALTAPFGPVPAAAEEDPASSAGAALEETFAAIHAVATSTAGGMQKRDAIGTRIAARLDDSALARGALGSEVERFSREEYADFAREYVRYVTWLLVQRVADAEQPARLVEAVHDPASGLVRASALGRERSSLFRFQRGAAEGRSELGFTLRRSYGEWRVAGLSIDGVDVTRLFRDQFASVLERSEPAALIEDLRRRNRESEDVDPFV